MGNSLSSDGRVSDLALGIRADSGGQHLADNSHHRYGVRGGLGRFFIDRYNRPKLVYTSSSSKTYELHFRTKNGQLVKRNCNLLVVYMYNKGNSDAFQPRVGLSFSRSFDEKQELQAGFFVDSQPINLELREIPVAVEGGPRSISEKQLAYSLVKNGFTHADTIMKKTASPFVIAFAFKNSKNFYFASEIIVSIPLGNVRPVSLTGRAKDIPATNLSHDYDFMLEAVHWDKLTIIKEEEQLLFKREPFVDRLIRHRLEASKRDQSSFKEAS